MPDWRELVRGRLAKLALNQREREEIFAELAHHLEETYDALRRDGFSESAAVRRVFAQVRNWKDLQNEIYMARKENDMTPRAARLWLPSLVTLFLSMSTIILFSFLGLKPGPLSLKGWLHGMNVISDYTVWLMVLPMIGATGALMSGRAGGTRGAIVLSGVFPAVAWSAILLIVLSFSFFRLHNLETITAPTGLFGLLIVLVFAPAVCLLIGVLGYFVLGKRIVKPALTKLPS